MTGCLGSWQSAIGAVELPILVLSIGRIVGEKSQFHQQYCFWVIVGEIACFQQLAEATVVCEGN
jgi:hypothetical protein